MLVRTKNDISQWFKFFLVGVIETADKGIRTFDSILQLQKLVDQKIKTLGRGVANAQKITEYLYHRPLINAEKVSEVAGVSSPSAYKIIGNLERLGIIRRLPRAAGERVYIRGLRKPVSLTKQ